MIKPFKAERDARRQRALEAKARQRAFQDAEFRRLAARAASFDKSDPFVYGRVLAQLRSGVLTAADIPIPSENI